MKFTCTKENLTKAILVVNNIAGKQSNLPILSNILFKVDSTKVEIIATNLEIAIKTNIRAKIEKEGAFTIPAKILADYTNLIDTEQILIEQQGNEIHVTSGTTTTKIKGIPADDYPVIPVVDGGVDYQILVNPFKDALTKVVFSASKNEIRPELSGIYFGFSTPRYEAGLVMASTDSYRLSEKKVSLNGNKTPMKCIIPARTVQEMIRLLTAMKDEREDTVSLHVASSQMVMRYGDVELVSRLIDGEYPDYVQIIPTEHKTNVTISKEQFVKHMKAASLFSSSGMNGVLFDVNTPNGLLKLTSSNIQAGEYASDVPAEISGDSNTMILNYRYVLDGIQQLDGDVEIRMTSNEAPALFFQKGDDSYLYIVMPIRQ